jgi:hypothetical protein
MSEPEERCFVGTKVPKDLAGVAKWTAHVTKTGPHRDTGLTVTDQVVLGLSILHGLPAPPNVRAKLARVLEAMEAPDSTLPGLDLAS